MPEAPCQRRSCSLVGRFALTRFVPIPPRPAAGDSPRMKRAACHCTRSLAHAFACKHGTTRNAIRAMGSAAADRFDPAGAAGAGGTRCTGAADARDRGPSGQCHRDRRRVRGFGPAAACCATRAAAARRRRLGGGRARCARHVVDRRPHAADQPAGSPQQRRAGAGARQQRRHGAAGDGTRRRLQPAPPRALSRDGHAGRPLARGRADQGGPDRRRSKRDATRYRVASARTSTCVR